MLSPAEIRTFIDSDSASTRKQLARQGQRYYEGDHDIRNYRLFFINTPTVAELEAKVKTGETISLVDLAETVKADKERGKAAKTEKKPFTLIMAS